MPSPSPRALAGAVAAFAGAVATLAGPVAVALSIAAPARAESGLRLDLPNGFGAIPAATYDTHRERVGAAHLVIERLDGGNVRIFSESGFEGGSRTVAMAELAPVAGNRRLQPIVQESRSFDPDGTPLGVLRIDHRARRGTCTSNGGQAPARSLELPESDRVANVPMNLFFLPLVRGTRERLDFQFFLCGGGPRLVDFQATRVPAGGHDGAPETVEIRYGPTLSPVLALLAPRFLPRLSFWFDPAEPHRWLAHRIPLYGDGPEVLVIRDGIPPSWLDDE